MTLDAFRQFGALLGTDAPIHCDPSYAAATPFEVVISQGPLLLAPFESWLCELFGHQAWSESGHLKAKFLVPAKVGSRITLEMIIREIAHMKIRFDLRATSGETLLAVATAELSLLSD